jgi:4'-phosphopantetheinyl transferase
MAGVPLLQRLESEVHVWHTDPASITDAKTLAGYESMLAPEEKARYRRFQFAKDQHRFLVSHAMVRTVLSRYCDRDPAGWRFGYNRRGRPELKQPGEVDGLRFNLTHTTGLSACVVTRHLDCGIDAEDHTGDREMQKVAARMFASPELASLGNFESRNSRLKFFTIWTLREAYGKALGLGLAGSSRALHFEVRDDSRADIHFARTSDGNGSDWQFNLLRPTANHVAAIAVHRPGLVDRLVQVWTITP